MKWLYPLKTLKIISRRLPLEYDLYHWLLSLPWPHFLVLVTVLYLLVNLFFALAYLSTGNGIANAEIGSFKDTFFLAFRPSRLLVMGLCIPRVFMLNF